MTKAQMIHMCTFYKVLNPIKELGLLDVHLDMKSTLGETRSFFSKRHLCWLLELGDDWPNVLTSDLLA